VFRPGVEIVLNAVVPVNGKTTKVLIVEGSKQQLAAASYAPKGWAIYGVAGCWNWTHADFTCFEGYEVVVIFDGDLRGNRQVWDGAEALSENLRFDGATLVKYAVLPRVEKEGLDDFLAKRPENKRASTLQRLIESAEVKLPRQPAKSAGKPKKKFFDDERGLLVETLVKAAFDDHPALLTPERSGIAPYVNGVFKIDSNGSAFEAVITGLLGEDHRPSHMAAAREAGRGYLYRNGLLLPDDPPKEPLLNCFNGMLHLLTGELLDHDPRYQSVTQIPVAWDPEAECPTYVSWLSSVIPDQADDLEEVVATMLDPSRTPTKAAFLYGPSRSGKSTLLRIVKAVAGKPNVSSTNLHQLTSDRFMVATLYGKMVNSAADLSSAHIEDISIFKQVTGDDMITANRKYGGTFEFTNRALFTFAANELPTVGETSRAYVERMKPFRFDHSFAGHEDPSIERRMMRELPGILVRWVAAHQRHMARGGYQLTNPDVQHDFDVRSDRVRQWVDERMEIHDVDGAEIPVGKGTASRELARLFNRWAEDSNGSRMGERKVLDRLRQFPGIFEGREKDSGRRVWNLTERKNGFEATFTGTSGTSGTFTATRPMRGAQFENEVSVPHGEGSSESAGTAGSAGATRLAFDLETTGKDLWSRGPDFVRIAGIRCDGGDVTCASDIAYVVELIRRSRMIIGHNIMGFDLLALARYHGLDIFELAARGAIRDTLILASLADPPEAHMTGKVERRYGLDHLGTELLGEGKHGDLKKLAKEFGGYDLIPLDDPRFLEYISGDVVVTDRLAEVLPWTPYAEREHRIAAIAAQISLNGFRVDVPALCKRRDHIREIRASRVTELQERYGLPTHTKDGKKEAAAPQNMEAGREAIRKAFEALGAPLMPKTTTGMPATSVTAMDKMIRHYGHLAGVTELATTVKELAGQRVIYETIDEHRVDDRVHPSISFRQSSGRWSVTKPGLTVMGKNGDRVYEREVFLSEPGEVLLAFDLSQVDARAVAALSQDLEYMKLFEPGRDSHTEVALRVFGDAGMRDKAKIIGHGWNYGMGIDGMVRNGVERDLAEQFDREMKISFPRLNQWKTEVRRQAEASELLDNGFGRKMRPDPVRAWTQAPALMGQGCARDIMMTGLMQLPREVLPMLRAQVHDEIVLSVPADAVEDVKDAVLEALNFEWRGVPIVAEEPKNLGRNWADCYRKE
jgi:P4 family phage/plasmid primase-like protien